MAHAPKNRWTRALDRRASTLSAGAMFGLYVAGGVLLIVSVFIVLGGLLLVTGTTGSGWVSRIVGVALIAIAAGLFRFGLWATNQYTVQRRN